jgi:hypothetical protein
MAVLAAVMGAVYFDAFRSSVEALVGDCTVIVATHLWTLLALTLTLAAVCATLPTLVHATLRWMEYTLLYPIRAVTVPMTTAEATRGALSLEHHPQYDEMLLYDPNSDEDEFSPDEMQCYDPSTMQRLGSLHIWTKSDVEGAVARARHAQRSWKLTTFAERRRVLRTLQKYIVDHTEEICTVASRDSGKGKLGALMGEVLVTCEKISYLLNEGEKVLSPEQRPVGMLTMHKRAWVEYEPLGVIGVIAPFNYPFHNLYNHIVSSLFAGNGSVTKVSEVFYPTLPFYTIPYPYRTIPYSTLFYLVLTYLILSSPSSPPGVARDTTSASYARC